MRFRSTFILLGVFVVLGGYVYFAEYRGQDQREKQEASKKKLFPTPPKDVTELSLAFPDHKISAVKKDEKHWEITEPQGVEADSAQWDMLASGLGDIEKEGVVATTSTDLAPFGLDKPAVQVTAKLKDGHTVSVLFGGENPRKTQAYAKLADNAEVFLSPVSSSKTFQKSLMDLRDKKVLDIAVDDISSVRIEDGKNQVEIQKSGMDWLLKKPLEVKADGAEVSAFLGLIQSAHALSFVDEEIKPEMKITLHDGKANADRILSIGKSSEADKYNARSEGRKSIAVIDKEIPAKARRPVLDWRDKSIVHFEMDAVDKVDEIELNRGTEKISLKRQGMDWKLADGRKVPSDKVSNVLAALEFDRFVQIIDAPGSLSTYGVDKPRLEVTLRQAGKDLVSLKFGNATHNPEGAYLKVSTSPAVMTVSTDLYGKFNLKADDFAETQPATK